MKHLPVGVVMPVWREGDRAVKAVAHLRDGGFGGPIVVSMADGDAETAPPPGVAIVTGPVGRGGQMNRGAAGLGVDTILFLHADTVVDPTVVATLDRRCDAADAVAGAFTLAYDAKGFGLRLVERGVALRSRWFSLPYGDQAIFVKRELFERVGGYPAIPLMEEVGLLDRLRNEGKIVILPERAVASARRYERRGVARVMLSNMVLFAAYRCGVDPERLYDRYYAGGR